MRVELETEDISMLYLILGFAVASASKDGDTILRDDFMNFTRKFETKVRNSLTEEDRVIGR